MGFIGDILQNTANMLHGVGINTPELGMTEGAGGANVATTYKLPDTNEVYTSPSGALSGQHQIGNKIYDFSGQNVRYLSDVAPSPKDPVSDPNQNPNLDLGGGGGAGGGGSSINSALVSAYLSQIGSLPEVLKNLLSSNQDQYDSVTGGYKREFKSAEDKYGQAVTTNEQNKDTSIQAAELAAAQGARGLRAVLASIGALGGTGSVLADRAVASEANRDIGTAKKTFDSNATSLTDTWNETQIAEEKRQEDARIALENSNRLSRGDVAGQNQDIFAKLAQLYGDAGDTTNANQYVQKGISQQPLVTAASRTTAPVYNKNPLAFTPEKLAAYLGGQNDMSVNVAGSGGLPVSSIFTTTKKRDQELA